MNIQRIKAYFKTGIHSRMAVFANKDDYLYVFADTVAGFHSIKKGFHHARKDYKLLGVYEKMQADNAIEDIEKHYRLKK